MPGFNSRRNPFIGHGKILRCEYMRTVELKEMYSPLTPSRDKAGIRLGIGRSVEAAS